MAAARHVSRRPGRGALAVTFSPARERLALEHLEIALAWPEHERDSRLAAALGHDAELLQNVRELLATAVHSDLALPTRLPMAPPIEDTPPPERIGPYRLNGLLGSGGMGRVFRASRADGLFEHEVAIKLTRRTRMAQLVAEQFARERQILARLQHRNIAQLFDGGVTAEGESWFVMEMVTGLAVTDYVNEHKLGLRERLQLFRQIAGAVQHAHAHLVVHADIKPSNVIVTRDGTAKLLDFGVSRVLANVADENTDTPLGLTFKYASPARRAGEAAGTADDIYSLGVLLDEMLRPLGKLAADLESILAKATAASAEQRYPTVEAMQNDVQRWLTGHPVTAHPGGWNYYARRLIGRHLITAVVASIAMMLLATAAVALGVLYVRAEQARVEADLARRKAEQRFAEVRQLSRYMLFDMYDRLDNVPRTLMLRRDLADAAQRYLDGLSKDPDAPIAVKLEVIEGLRRLAQVQATPGKASLALVPQARRNLGLAQQLAESLTAVGADAETRTEVLARVLLARVRLNLGVDLDVARAHTTLDQAEKLVNTGLTSNSAIIRQALLSDVAALRSEALQWQGKYQEAIAVTTAELARSRPPEESWTRVQTLEVARLYDLQAEAIYYSGKPPAAEAPYRKQLQLLQALQKKLPDDMQVARQAQRAAWALGTTLLELQRPAEAEPILAEAQRGAGELRRLDPQDPTLVRSETVLLLAHAQALVGLKRFDAAIPVFRAGVALRLAARQASPDDFGVLRDYAVAVNMLADALADAGQPRAACAEYATSRRLFSELQSAGKLTQLDQDYMQRLANARFADICRSRVMPSQPVP
jgi:eukaryotic-like serine/threonine-protein kinase